MQSWVEILPLYWQMGYIDPLCEFYCSYILKESVYKGTVEIVRWQDTKQSGLEWVLILK